MMWPPIGINDMLSRPPATITSAAPVLMRSAAIAIDCKPDEQKRLIVIALVSTGKPARLAAARATFIPCSASGIAHPMITSSISEPSCSGTRSNALLMTVAPISSGRVVRNVPFGTFPTAVRTADTITASLITKPALLLIREYRVSAANFLVVFRSSTCAPCVPVSCACRSTTGTLRAPDLKDTAQTHALYDSDRRLLRFAPTAFQSQHHDPKCIRRASSDECRVLKWPAPAL